MEDVLKRNINKTKGDFHCCRVLLPFTNPNVKSAADIACSTTNHSLVRSQINIPKSSSFIMFKSASPTANSDPYLV